jgi:hypothetical protein
VSRHIADQAEFHDDELEMRGREFLCYRVREEVMVPGAVDNEESRRLQLEMFIEQVIFSINDLFYLTVEGWTRYESA